MAIEFELDSIDTLDESLKGLYSQGENGKFRLDVQGIPETKTEDVSGLKKKVDELLAEKKASEGKRKEAEEASRKAAEEVARKSGDVGALEKSWQEKFANTQAEKDAEIQRLNGSLNGVLVESVASRLASEIAVQGSAGVLLPHIRSRLAVDYQDGQPITRVLGLDGKPSAATVDELKAEFAANKAFAPIVAGTKASGGGAAGAGNGGGAAEKTMTRAAFDSLDYVGKTKALKAGTQITD
jgi:hypothetical protein